ncbi:SGNH/GDSL hydrolase family protein [Aureimonas sp. AU4]|uniref:SGNH/GDSL hydrolase family protein n=1 Tax=Aureimonas sp. AU4 TaxID=1638163 RepID=UPI000784F88E|nr:SGNH/GDSL hydrolase family protein [Aureimonas sp. AU4]
MGRKVALILVACLVLLVTTPPRPVEAAPRERDAEQIAYLGDSRVAAQFNDPIQHVASARFFGNVAAQLLDRRLKTALNLAVSGQRSDEYLSDRNVEQAIASPALWVLVFGVVNDIAQRGAQDYFAGNLAGLLHGVRGQIDKLRTAGLRPILVLEPGAAAFSADPARLASVAAYNNAVRAYADEHPEVIVFDLPAATTLAGAPLLFRSGYAHDGVHLDNLGGIAAGQAFAALMAPLLPAASNVAVENLVPNGEFAQPSGGEASGSTRGTVPRTYVARCDPGLDADVSAGEPGTLRMTVRAMAAGTCSLGADLLGEKVGQAYRESVGAEVAPGAVGLTGPYLQLQVRRAGVSLDAFDNFWGTGGPGPDAARSLSLETPSLVVPDGAREWFTTRFGLHFSGPGGASATFSRHRVTTP